MPPAGSIVDLPQYVFPRTPNGLPHVGMTCFRDQVMATVFEFKRYLIADPSIPIVDPNLCIDVFNTA
ncbi:MAG: hypothetical protein M3214_13655 [Actinomycetota bacterium]|jgi:hypothetical protein|nr:hypothetical protein [Actinomycetota bacterium]